MKPFQTSLTALVSKLDDAKHAEEKQKLARCRSVADLDKLAAANFGWLSSRTTDPRLKLVKHHSGTFLVLEYVDGWGTTLSMEEFWR